MRLANLGGRAALILGELALDVATASDGRFGPDPSRLYPQWDEFAEWAGSAPTVGASPFDRALLHAPSPSPKQVFAIGINYAAHAAEAGYSPDSAPVTFTKFPSSIVGPDVTVPLPTPTVDWEVELVVIIGRGGREIPAADAWQRVAGITIGEDLSERTSQLEGNRPQFSLAKSYPFFGPTGPWLVTVEEVANPDDLAISCSLSGELMQESRTSQMVYTVPMLIERLSSVCELYPGDVIFTGTPDGIGNARTPKRFIQPGDVLRSEIEGLGWMEQHFADRGGEAPGR